jgi:Mrp family chromosome partitioning ATPase
MMSDAAVLSPLCDGIILVMRAGHTNLRDIRRGREQLDVVQAPIIGAAVNMLDMRKDPYYYGRYGYKYRGYYEQTEAEGSGSSLSRIWTRVTGSPATSQNKAK